MWGVTASAPSLPNRIGCGIKYSKIIASWVFIPRDVGWHCSCRLVRVGVRSWDSRGGSLSKYVIDGTERPTLGLKQPRATNAQFPWFALQVHAKHEFGVANSLRSRGYDPFLPLCRCRKLWSDRIKLVEAPLFPGYMFCRLNLHYRLPILTAPGVIRIVGHTRLTRAGG